MDPLVAHMVMGESVATLLKFAVLPIVKVLAMCLLGLCLASKYLNILPTAGRRQLSQLVFNLFLPCLIFTQLGKVITFEKIIKWWFIPVNVLISSTLGCLLGYAVALLVKPPPQFFNFTYIMIGIGNIGNIPLVILGAICREKGNPFEHPDTCNTNGVAYISFGQWVGAVVVYTFVYKKFAPPLILKEAERTTTADGVVSEAQTNIESAHATASSTDGNETNSGSETTLLISDAPPPNPQGWALVKVWLSNEAVANVFKPAIVASFLAMAFGCIPLVRSLIFTEHSFLYFFFDALNMLGGATIPCIMLVLGGNLVGGPGSSELGLHTTIAIVATRLLLIPPIGIAVVLIVEKLGFIPVGDKVFKFVLLLQHTMPSSILVGAVTNLRGHAEKEASAILFFEHVLAVISMAGWLVLYINVLFKVFKNTKSIQLSSM